MESDYSIMPVPFTDVRVRDGFWSRRLETNRSTTIPTCFRRCEETGRIDNFARAAGRMPGGFVGIPFDDSDVYKVIEGAAYSLASNPDPELDHYLDGLIKTIAAAQEPDGYLYTCRTINTQPIHRRAGPVRWFNEMGALTGADSHELYNVGHLYEAAVAHFQTTGKRTLLDVAIKNADLITSVWGPNGLHIPPGHQEIEIGLVKLCRVTGEMRYLDLAKFLLDQRGRGGKSVLSDHLPVRLQREAVGHAVRSCYMYAAMADIVALTGNADYLAAVDALWENVVGRKLYLTGGIGARHEGECFGEEYELPNETAYCETCAAIANCLWNHRMFLLHGDARYYDVFERTLYNGLLAGVSLSGERFFYPNPLAADGNARFNHGAAGRQAWFDCSCCPANVARFLPALPGHVYAQRDDAVYVNLFIGSEASVMLPQGELHLIQTTEYPWEGKVVLEMHPREPMKFELRVRVPGWTRGEVAPGDLYRDLDVSPTDPIIRINEEAFPLTLDKGYAIFAREWQSDDRVEIEFPMGVRRVVAHPAVKSNVGRVALTRGPLVYCFEGVDNQGSIDNLTLADTTPLRATHVPDLLGGATIINEEKPNGLRAVPYHLWNHRGDGAMAVWLRRGSLASGE